MSFSFGTPAPTTGGSFSFGGSAGGPSAAAPATATTTPSSFGFGAPASTTGFGAAPATTGFGAAPAATGFGAPAATTGFGATPTTTGFGATGFGTTGFGANTGFGAGTGFGASTFGSKSFGQTGQTGFGMTQPQPQQQQAPQDPLTAQLVAFEAAYNPESQFCKFRHVFYNMVPPGEAVKYAKPPNFPQELWDLAQKDNPDPSCFVPALAVGFADIQKRVTFQDSQTQIYDSLLNNIQGTLSALQNKHEVDTAVKILEFKRKHLQLTHRVLKIMKMLEVLRCKGYAVMPEEENLRIKLEGLQRELDRPTQFKGRVSELESLAQMLSESDVLQQQDNFRVTDENSVKQTQKVLSEQQQGLNHLVSLVKQDTEELDIMMKGFKERKVGVQTK